MKQNKKTREYIRELFASLMNEYGSISTESLTITVDQMNEFLKQNGLLEPKVEAGKWYWMSLNDTEYLALFKEMDSNNVLYRSKCYFYESKFKEAHGSFTDVKREATEDEVMDKLLNETKNRGFKEGVMVKSPWQSEMRIMGFNTRQVFNSRLNRLILGGMVVFNNGKWAEIVEPEQDTDKNAWIYEFEKEMWAKWKETKQRFFDQTGE